MKEADKTKKIEKIQMENTHNLYEIFKSKDERFDGKFFIGIKSTGIYCRTVCTARLPKEKNCVFFSTQAEAEAEGFRPCLICRPELAPEVTRLNSSKTLADIAIKLLEENIENEFPIKETTDTLGITDRHLRRIFKEEYKVTPIQYLQTYRLLLAKKLLTDTNLNISNVAMASGFRSLRRFNDTFQKNYHLTPTHFRKNAVTKNYKSNDKEITIPIGYYKPYRYKDILNFLQDRLIIGIEKIVNSTYYRTLSIKKNGEYINGYIAVSDNPDKNVINLTISGSLLKVLPQIIRKVKNMFDLSCDPYSIFKILKDVNDVIPNSFLIGTRVVGSINDFETCIRTIAGQLVSVKSAVTILKRITEKFGKKIDTGIEGLDYIFPTPEDIFCCSENNFEEIFGELGLTRIKTNAIKGITELFVKENLDFSTTVNSEKKIEKLLTIKGIGKWSAEYIAMRTMNCTDIFLDSDYAVKKIMEKYNLTKDNFEKYKPLKSYITFGIWNLAKREAKN